MDDELLREARDDVAALLSRMEVERWNHPGVIHKLRERLARIDARLATGGWIKASERLPDREFTHSKAMLVATPENLCVFCCTFDGKDWWIFGANSKLNYKVTHWQPIPALPKGEL